MYEYISYFFLCPLLSQAWSVWENKSKVKKMSEKDLGKNLRGSTRIPQSRGMSIPLDYKCKEKGSDDEDEHFADMFSYLSISVKHGDIMVNIADIPKRVSNGLKD